MYRFFVEPSAINDGCISIEGQDAHHIKNVLRMKLGDEIYISCGDEWEYACEISELTGKRVVASITDIQKTGRELKSKITLYQCMPKKDKFEQIIQKAVELGAYEIVPVISSRCVVKLKGEKSASKGERWNSIASAAAKQAKRLIEPVVHSPISFEEAVRSAAQKDAAFIPYERADGMNNTRRAFGQIKSGQSVGVIIGPEGGFDEKEVRTAIDAGVKSVTLGKRILRTETAGIAVLSVLMYLLESD